MLLVKNMPVNAGDVRDTESIPGSGKSPGEEDGNPLQYSEEFHEQRCSVGYSPWYDKESDMTSSLACTHAQLLIYRELNKVKIRHD